MYSVLSYTRILVDSPRTAACLSLVAMVTTHAVAELLIRVKQVKGFAGGLDRSNQLLLHGVNGKIHQ